MPKVHCEACGAKFVDEEGLRYCPECVMELEDFFGSVDEAFAVLGFPEPSEKDF